MKNIKFSITVFLMSLTGFFSACKLVDEPCENENTHVFYYYFDEKIYLEQVTNSIYIQFIPGATKKEMNAVIRSNTSLKASSLDLHDYATSHAVILETKNGNCISESSVKSLRQKEAVVSAEYLLYNGRKYSSINDQFVVKLKETTSYQQLQTLAENNNCIIKKKSLYVENQFVLSVLKTSNLNAIQMANLFHETGLFEFSDPDFITFNLFDV